MYIEGEKAPRQRERTQVKEERCRQAFLKVAKYPTKNKVSNDSPNPPLLHLHEGMEIEVRK